MLALHEKGLVEKTIDVPAKFQAIPIKRAIANLIQLRTENTVEIRKEAKQLITKFANSNKKIGSQDPEYLIMSKKEFYANCSNVIRSAQKSIDIVDATKNFQATANAYIDDIVTGVKRGVKYRIILEPLPLDHFPKKVRGLTQEGAIEIKYAKSQPDVSIFIMDKKGVMLVPIETGFSETVLCSNSPALFTTLQTLFDFLWQTAEKPKWLTEVEQKIKAPNKGQILS